MTRFVLTALLCIFAVPALASRPGGGEEGPSGCSRHATVTQLSNTSVDVKLGAEIGQCMYYFDGGCGAVGDVLKIDLSETTPDAANPPLAVGEDIKIWVWGGGKTASLKHPGCQ